MADNIPEACVGASGMPWNLPEPQCSVCGNRGAEGFRCASCHKLFCDPCADDPEIAIYCDSCDRLNCAACSLALQGYAAMLRDLRMEVGTLKSQLDRALAQLVKVKKPSWMNNRSPAARLTDEEVRRIEMALSLGTRAFR